MSNKGLESATQRAVRSIEEAASNGARAAYVKNDHTDRVDDGLTRLQQAIRANDNRTLDTLCFVETTGTIELNGVPIDINEIDSNGNTALHHAALVLNSRFAERLVSLKADPNIKNNEGKIPQDLVPEGDHLQYTLSPEIWPERETSEPGHSGGTMIDGPDGESTTYKNRGPERKTSQQGDLEWTVIHGPDGESTTHKNREHVCEGR